jgi:glutathione S-transferase
MKLFFKAGTCALAVHIVLAELNLNYELEAVDLKTKTSASGDFLEINPKGSVPALQLESGESLTEVAVINQYLVEQEKDTSLLPAAGTMERFRCLEWVNFIATDIHKSFSPIFHADRMIKNVESKTEMKMYFVELLKTKISLVAKQLGENDYLMGKQFTIADAYLFTVLSWSKHVGIDLSEWSAVNSYISRVSKRPAVIKAMQGEGRKVSL